MAKYSEIRAEIRKKINQPENELRGITEATGLRILDALYQIGNLLQHSIYAEADKFTQNRDE